MNPVARFYDRFSYPDIPSVALPSRGAGRALAYEVGATHAGRPEATHAGRRVLVVGAGTFEGAVVAQVHPRAAEVVAVDLSHRSIRRLQHRLTMARVRSAVFGLGLFHRIPPVDLRVGDMLEVDDGPYDYIIATLVLHHHPEPLRLLTHLAGLLAPGGLLRLVTYPKHSRFWPRAVGRWLRLGGVTADDPDLRAAARGRVAELPAGHPIRASFDDNPESRTRSGIADCYLHPCENPQPPSTWGRWCSQLGLQMIAEAHGEAYQSSFIEEVSPAVAPLSRWQKLDLMDDLLELTGNPVLWFQRSEGPVDAVPEPTWGPSPAPAGGPSGHRLTDALAVDEVVADLEAPLYLPSALHHEVSAAVQRWSQTLEAIGTTPQKVLDEVYEATGPRMSLRQRRRELEGLTLYELLSGDASFTAAPWGDERWRSLSRAVPGASLTQSGAPVPGQDLHAQVEYLQLTRGIAAPWIGPLGLAAAR